MRSLRPRRLRQRHSRGELRAVVDEVTALFHRLRWVAEQIYGEPGRSTARRGILRGLARFGPQTVPRLARVRSVSRQHVQQVVDALFADGLVTLTVNPRHARSSLIGVTAAGEQLVRRMDEIDARVLQAAAGHLPRPELAVTVRTLRALRESFELTSRWSDATGLTPSARAARTAAPSP